MNVSIKVRRPAGLDEIIAYVVLENQGLTQHLSAYMGVDEEDVVNQAREDVKKYKKNLHIK